ncbi:CHAD domain-containing protein [Shivajiella indica]|uniref:CHAD domain-containing protein n=1 Tax=Shivajiella indica TaxID=872115 RepID=A0ABW5B3A1_9BACT
MPSKAKQKSYLFTHWHNMRHHFSQFLNAREMNDLHQMRIHIKKIHALVIFIAYLNESQEVKRSFKPVKTLFRKAGKIRELQIHFEKLKKENKDKSLLAKKLNKQIEAETIRFLKKKKKWIDIVQNTYPNIDSKITNCPEGKLIVYLKTSISEVFKYFNKENFHEARKIIKVILNLHTLLSKFSAGSLKLNLSYLDEMQNKIGNWNDLEQRIKRLKKSQRSKSEIMEFKILTKELIRSKKELKKSVYLNTVSVQ